MAAKRNPAKKQKDSTGIGCLFWIAFLLLVIILFFINRPTIVGVLERTKFIEKILPKTQTKLPEQAVPDKPAERAPSPEKVTTVPSGGQSKSNKQPEPIVPQLTPKVSVLEEESSKTPKPASTPPAMTESTKNSTPPTGKTTDNTVPKPTVPTSNPAASSETTTVKEPSPVNEKPTVPASVQKEPAPLKDRSLWLVKIYDDGVISREKVMRPIKVSDSPLTDAIGALLAGPSAEERKKGLTSLIPDGTKLISILVRGSTAYLNFNEQFQFNSHGVEGYVQQLRQVIWTATEFESVKDVQILIDGRRLDYLGPEGIQIGKPLDRDSI